MKSVFVLLSALVSLSAYSKGESTSACQNIYASVENEELLAELYEAGLNIITDYRIGLDILEPHYIIETTSSSSYHYIEKGSPCSPLRFFQNGCGVGKAKASLKEFRKNSYGKNYISYSKSFEKVIEKEHQVFAGKQDKIMDKLIFKVERKAISKLKDLCL